MQTNDFYGNVLFPHTNLSPSKQKLSGTQHHFKWGAERHLLLDMSSLTVFLHQSKRGIRSEASNEPFFGTDTRWEPNLK